MNPNTAAIIIISEELLSGKKEFHLGKPLPFLLVPKWNIKKLIVLPYHIQLVKYEVQMAFKMCEIVIVIQEVENVDVCNVISSLFHENVESFSAICDVKNKVNTPFKLFTVKNDAKDFSSPVVTFQRIFLLQGVIPSLMSAYNVLKLYLNDYKTEVQYKKKFEVLSNKSPDNIFNEQVDIEIDRENEKVIITAKAAKLNTITIIENRILNEFGAQNVSHRADDLNIFDSYYFHVDPHIGKTIQVRALIICILLVFVLHLNCNCFCLCQIIEECFKKYGPDNVFISFNGGKDCTVLLHLALAVLQKNYPGVKNPLCMYVRSEFAFPEQDAFIQHCQNYYNLEVIATQSYIKEGLKTILEKKPNLKACLMGTRRTDPFSATLNTFQVSSIYY